MDTSAGHVSRCIEKLSSRRSNEVPARARMRARLCDVGDADIAVSRMVMRRSRAPSRPGRRRSSASHSSATYAAAVRNLTAWRCCHLLLLPSARPSARPTSARRHAVRCGRSPCLEFRRCRCWLWYTCLCACLYTCLHTCLYECPYTCIYTYHIRMHAYTYVYTRVYTLVYVQI